MQRDRETDRRSERERADLQRSRLWQTREKECDPDRESKAEKCRKTERDREEEAQTERQT